MSTIYILSYDHNWGMRGSRNKSEFYFTEKMAPSAQIAFLAGKLNKPVDAVRKEAIQIIEIEEGTERNVSFAHS